MTHVTPVGSDAVEKHSPVKCNMAQTGNVCTQVTSSKAAVLAWNCPDLSRERRLRPLQAKRNLIGWPDLLHPSSLAAYHLIGSGFPAYHLIGWPGLLHSSSLPDSLRTFHGTGSTTAFESTFELIHVTKRKARDKILLGSPYPTTRVHQISM